MRRYLRVLFLLSTVLFFCKEHKMGNYSIFPPNPIMIPFGQDEIVHLFSVHRMNSIGMVRDEQWAIATIKGDDIHLDNFPIDKFECSNCKAIVQNKLLEVYFRSDKSVGILNWSAKQVISEYFDFSKSTSIGIEGAKIINDQKGIAISVFCYNSKDMKSHYSFVIDDILNKKRLKEIPIPDDCARQFPVYFTPSYVFYRHNYKTLWLALDNDLNVTSHPLVDLLNKDPSNSVYSVLDDNMLVSEEKKHALIVSYSKAADKDMLFLATWHGDPKMQPIVMDTSEIGPRRLVTYPNINTMSPSGKWVYFATKEEGKLPATHYIIYLDPKLPNGYLPPFKLGIEGNVQCAGWMTTPEGLVLYKDAKLWYFDLSHFEGSKFSVPK